MFPINPKAVCGVWCALMACGWGQNAVPNSGDRLAEETAIRLHEFAKNNNRGDPHRPMSPEMKAISRTPDLLANLRLEDLVKMSLEDPLLKYAYASVFMHSFGPFEQLEPPLDLVLADMRRRGEAVSPMLLKLIEENRETRIESSVLAKIEHVGTIRLEPFLEYARKLLRERTQSDVVAVASGLLARHGTKEDIELFEWVLTQRPFAVTSLTNSLRKLRTRLDSPPATRLAQREIPSSNAGNGIGPVEDVENHPQDGDSAISQTKPWIISGIILMVLLGAYRFLRQKLRGPRR